MPAVESTAPVAEATSQVPRVIEPAKPKAEAGEPMLGQMILGLDKRNPLFTVYHDESGEQLLVYYGFEIVEIVPDNPESAAYKLMLGRLYNSGLKLGSLCERFQVDPKTLRRWGRALKGSPEEMVRILEGRTAKRKRTVEVEAFARLRWPDLIAERSYGAVGRLQEEIHAVFGVTISVSGLRTLTRELKQGTPPSQTETAVNSEVVLSEESSVVEPASDGACFSLEGEIQKRETCATCLVGEPVDVSWLSPANLQEIRDVSNPPPSANTAHYSPFFPKDPLGGSYWCDHAGVLIFAGVLGAISKVSAIPQQILAQWMAALWLEAQNIERTKFLNWEDLELILGPGVRYPTQQRDQLKELSADSQLINALLRFNQEKLGESVGTDFYFDPHVKHYTGEQNVLKGWCSKIRFADKIVQSDFIHTDRGAPIYFETTDNFADLRERFFGVVERARTVLGWPVDRVLTMVVDRGIYGEEVFERVIEDPFLHLITWQKGFVAESWDSSQVTGKTVITRCRNSSTDLKSYHFQYFERPWKKNPKLRQIVVLATDSKGRKLQVAVLTDAPKRSAEEVLKLIFRRWLQENDFKYLEQHFGINQITSYRSIDYEKLKDQVEDREVRSASRKALDQRLKKATQALTQELLAEEQALQAHTPGQQERQQLTEELTQLACDDLPPRATIHRRLTALQRSDQRYELTRVWRREKIVQCHQGITEIKTEIAATAATESRLEALIKAGMVKLEPQSKRLMDILRITARNVFYDALQPFKKAYDNYRDDHDHFRKLTQSAGVLEVGPTEILIHLFPRTNYGGSLRRIVTQTLETLNQQNLDHPCLPGRKLRFRLAQRSELDLKVRVGQ